MDVRSQVRAAREGVDPALVCRVSSGWVVLCGMQFLSGYCILLPDPVVESLNALGREGRAAFLCDMATVGDALQEVTGAYRINYAIMGNSDPVLHAHIVPRYLSEPDEFRRGGSWSYPQELIDTKVFDPVCDRELKLKLADAIQKRL